LKLVTYVFDDCERIGSLNGDRVVDLREARALQLLSQGLPVKEASRKACADIPNCMIRFIEGGGEALAAARESQEFAIGSEELGKTAHLLENVTLKAPVPRPRMILNMGNAYRPLEIKDFTFKPVTCVIGPDEPIVIPKEISDFGAVFECEVGVVIGKKGRRIPNDETAFDHVYGYVVYNDITDYGRQMRGAFDMKIFDTFCPMGPCIVPRDEIKDPYSLTKRAWVNGQLATETNTREMLRKIPEFISVPSRTLTLQPGTVISTGAANTGRLKPGDILELEISKMGRMKNPVVAEQ